MGNKKKHKQIQQIQESKIEVLDTPMNRFEILVEQKFVYNYLKGRLLKKQIRNVESEKIRIQIAKAMIHGLNTMNTTLKDEQLDLMLEELKQIKNSINQQQHEIDEEERKQLEQEIEEVEHELEKIENNKR